MKKILAWLKSPASDFWLFILVLIFLNLTAGKFFFRLDLTAQHSFSLSDASKELVRSLDEPLSVKVFFSSGLPAPYNAAGRYLQDLLSEYEGVSSGRFSCEFFDMDDPENQQTASEYGLSQVQIQELSDNELGFRNAWMGLAAVYRDRIETLNEIQSEEGLEYKLTTLFAQMIAQANTLEGLDGTIEVCLYTTDALRSFSVSEISVLDIIREEVLQAYTKLNAENMDRLSFREESPSGKEAESAAQQYGLQALSWDNGGTPAYGTLGLVLKHGGDFRSVPLRLTQGLFGGYGVSGLDALEENLSAALKSLMAKTLTVGYLTGHGEIPLYTGNAGSVPAAQGLNAANFAANAADRYTFAEVNLAEGSVPPGIDCLVINGPKTAFSQEELYRLDQFVLSGGNLMVFLDPFDVVTPEGASAYYAAPQFVPVETGLETVLSAYGINIGKNYVLDTECYEDLSMRGAPGSALYYVPVVQRQGMDPHHPVSRNLAYVLFLQAAEVSFQQPENGGELTATALARSSDSSWLAGNPETFLTDFMAPPSAAENLAPRTLALLVEGTFPSAFDGPLPLSGNGSRSASADEGTEEPQAAVSGALSVTNPHLTQSVRPGRIFAVGSSAVTTQQVVDGNCEQPVSVFLRNALDALNGAEEFCVMRTKGMSLNTLRVNQGAAVQAAALFNQYGLPLLVALAGLVAWRHRASRRKTIRARYAAMQNNGVPGVQENAEEKAEEEK